MKAPSPKAIKIRDAKCAHQYFHLLVARPPLGAWRFTLKVPSPQAILNQGCQMRPPVLSFIGGASPRWAHGGLLVISAEIPDPSGEWNKRATFRERKENGVHRKIPAFQIEMQVSPALNFRYFTCLPDKEHIKIFAAFY